jgi:hypothetical protein
LIRATLLYIPDFVPQLGLRADTGKPKHHVCFAKGYATRQEGVNNDHLSAELVTLDMADYHERELFIHLKTGSLAHLIRASIAILGF